MDRAVKSLIKPAVLDSFAGEGHRLSLPTSHPPMKQALMRLAAVAFFTTAVATACSSTTDLGATDSTATNVKLPNDTAMVKFVGLTWPATPNPCLSAFTITWTVTVDSAKVGDVLLAHVTGPGSPGAVRTTLVADSQTVVTKFTAPAGVGSWTGTVDSVGNKHPRGFLLSVTSSVLSC